MKSLKLIELDIDRPDEATARLLSRICPVVLYSGDSIRPRWHFGERKIFQNLWVFIGSGEGVFKVGNKKFTVQENDFIWIPPDTINDMQGTSEKMHCIWCHIDLLYDSQRSRLFRVPSGVRNLEPWKKFIQPPIDHKSIVPLYGLTKPSNPLQVKMLLQELCRTHRIEPNMTFKLAGLALQIINELLGARQIKNSLDEKTNDAVIKIREQVNQNLDITELAGRVGLSASYFRAVFRDTHGIGPIAFHRQLRIKEACNLLLYEGLNVSETSDTLGFSCIQSFSRAFKAVMGVSPKKFLGSDE